MQRLKSLIALVFLSPISIVLVGGVIGFVASLGVYVVCLMPFLMGMLAGVLAIAWRLRLGLHRVLAVPLALIFGLSIYGSYQYSRYLFTVRELENPPTFVEYLDLRADFGLSIGRSSGGLPLEGNMVYLYWLTEIALSAGVASWIAGQERVTTNVSTAQKATPRPRREIR